jgi:hypothetical protein
MPPQSKGHGNPPQWPTIEEQLAAAKVAPGSALEQLIRNNQETQMLRAEEVNDKVRLPSWIRIYWRKSHPEGKYVGPSGGYPLLLKQLHDWMITHQDLPGHHLPNNPAPPKSGGRHGK